MRRRSSDYWMETTDEYVRQIDGGERWMESFHAWSGDCGLMVAWVVVVQTRTGSPASWALVGVAAVALDPVEHNL